MGIHGGEDEYNHIRVLLFFSENLDGNVHPNGGCVTFGIVAAVLPSQATIVPAPPGTYVGACSHHSPPTQNHSATPSDSQGDLGGRACLRRGEAGGCGCQG